MKLPVRPLAIAKIAREIRTGEAETRPLAVGGARELVPVLARELRRGGDETAVVEAEPERAAGFVYILAGPVRDEDERALRAADRADVPTVCVAPPEVAAGEIPYVLATDVVAVPPGGGFPVDEIVRAVARKLDEKGSGLAARLPVLRPAVCERLIERSARGAAAIGASTFIPGADLPALALSQIRLVLRLAHAHGLELDRDRAVEIVGVLGAGFGFRAAAREALGLVPVAGWAVKGAIAYFGTRALGEAALRYLAARQA